MFLNKKLIIAALAGISLLAVSSCRKFLDVNTNPNIAKTATLATLLPAGQLSLSSAYGVDLQINGSFWAGYWTQSPIASQYKSVEQYTMGQDEFSYPWDNLYSACENFYQLGLQADKEKNRHYKAISLLMRAYTFQLIADGWGDVPFRQALKGQEGISSPAYDSQVVVYRGIIDYIDTAEALINMTSVSPGSDDLIYGGDMDKWRKFGYTLKLRTLTRLSEINPTWAQTAVAALYADPNTQFMTRGDDATISFGSNTTNSNPLYADATGLNGTQNLVGSKTCIDSMNANNDYRVYVFYEALSNGSVAGLVQGGFASTSSISNFSLPSYHVGGNASNSKSGKAPLIFMSASESYFLQAEVAARGWVSTPAQAETLFYKGVEESFLYNSANLTTETGTDGATAYDIYINGDASTSTPPAYWGVFPTGGSTTAMVRHIITGKWFAMCGTQGFEAWTEYRRTGYPSFFKPSIASTIGSALPKRFKYPSTESTRNSKYPGTKELTESVWWDKF
ncbi:MAG: SusD/RagB family nutrient-binding outer membrane lipoprotein [Chitinophagia bacterium]|nr:SusD/RagB family nutrient-binding outer membrane lipoprotein [Chitinophagia bacterium]